MSAVRVHGDFDARWSPLVETFEQNFRDDLEIGASLCVTQAGRTVLDVWAGDRCGRATGPWQRDTIVIVFSSSKIALILSALLLVERGALALDAPVARYWPEFAQGGKAQVTVRQALAHQAGVPGLKVQQAQALLGDWDAVTALIAAEPHWFGGDPQGCYHFVNYGFLIGELIRRVDGRMPREFVAEELAAPLGVELAIGLSDAQHAHMSDIDLSAMPVDWAEPGLCEDIVATWDGDADPDQFVELFSNAQIPAGNCWTNARGVARICAVLACGGTLDGHRYLAPALVAEALREHWIGHCPLLGNIRMALGLGLDSTWFPAPTKSCVHWGGMGGSWGLMDPATGISAGYAMNRGDFPEFEEIQWSPNGRQQRLWRVLGELMESSTRVRRDG